MATAYVNIVLERAPDAPSGLRSTMTSLDRQRVATTVAPLDVGERNERWWNELFERSTDALRNGVEPLRVGADLTDLLLPGDVRNHLTQLISPTRHLGVVVHLGEGLDHLWSLPWELVRHHRQFLVASEHVSLMRGLDASASGPFGDSLRRILVVDGPRKVNGEPELPLSSVEGDVRTTLRHRSDSIRRLDSPDRAGLAAAVAGDEPVDLLVFRGHGHADGLWLADPTGREPSALTPTEELVDTLAGRVRVALLGSCYTGGSDVRAGLAQQLAAHGVFTIACQSSVESPAVALFVRGFLEALVSGDDVVEATAKSRRALRESENVVAASARTVIWMPGRRPPLLRVPTAHPTLGPYEHLVTRSAIDEVTRARSDDRVRLVHLVGEGGSGKSTIIRWLQRTEPGVIIPEGGSTRSVAEALGAALWPLTGSVGTWAERMAHLGTATAIWDAVIDELVPDADRKSPDLLLVLDEVAVTETTDSAALHDSVVRLPRWVTTVFVGAHMLPSLGYIGEEIRVIDAGAGDGAVARYTATLLRSLRQPPADIDATVGDLLRSGIGGSFPLAERAVKEWDRQRGSDDSPPRRWGAISRRGAKSIVFTTGAGPILNAVFGESLLAPLEADGSTVVSSDGRVVASLVDGCLELAWINRFVPRINPWPRPIELGVGEATLLAVGMSSVDGVRCVLSTDAETLLVRATPAVPPRMDVHESAPSRAAVIVQRDIGTVDANGIARGWLHRRLSRFRTVVAVDSARVGSRTVLAAVGRNAAGKVALVTTFGEGGSRSVPLDDATDDVMIVRPLDPLGGPVTVLTKAGAVVNRHDVSS